MSAETTLVFYASYGSNMNQSRFMRYLAGGRVPGLTVDFPGARDPSPPRLALTRREPRRLFFAQSSNWWGHGGVAFLHPSADAALPLSEHTVMRMYLITLEQFFDVVRQENVHAVGHLSASLVSELRREGPGAARRVSEGW